MQAGETVLCLHRDRFRTEVSWSDPRHGGAGAGRARPVTGDSGAFWFFRPANLELMVKLLDGRPVNGHFWVFASALTDLELQLSIYDTASGLGRRYHSPPLPVGQVTDTAAFDPRLAAGSLMWIGAHPDDEIWMAPLLGQACVEAGGSCTLLVATRGEAGPCRLPAGCAPDLPTVREAEMVEAAALFGARLVQWGLPDGFGPDPAAVRRAWAAADGGDGMLVDRLASEIARAAAERVVTFDPRHGSTCHPDHRAVGELVLAAVARLGAGALPVWLVEAVPHAGTGSAGFAAAVPGDDRVTSYDATRSLAAVGGEAWRYVALVASAHRSQFAPEQVAALAAARPTERRLFALPASALASTDLRYPALCAP